jgi:hypothetical protein
MTNSIVPSNFSFLVGTVREDGLVNITALSTTYRIKTGKTKKPSDWLLTREAKESILFLAQASGITEASLVIVENGVGTWVHPYLAEIFAQWCSVEYRFAVVDLIRAAKTDRIVAPPTPKPQLLPSELAVKTSDDIVKIQGNLGASNPRLAQILVDFAMNNLIESKPALPVSTEFPEDRWYGLVQIADKMGIKTNLSTRVKLGQHFGNLIRAGELDVERVQEERLCNGQPESIWCYRDNETVRKTIYDWARANSML